MHSTHDNKINNNNNNLFIWMGLWLKTISLNLFLIDCFRVLISNSSNVHEQKHSIINLGSMSFELLICGQFRKLIDHHP